MKKLCIFFLFLSCLMALAAPIRPPPQTTVWSQDFLTAIDAAAARIKIGANITNNFWITNYAGNFTGIVYGAVGTILTNPVFEGSATGTVTGTFIGDGSGLTGVATGVLATNAINATNIYGAGLASMTNAAITVTDEALIRSNTWVKAGTSVTVGTNITATGVEYTVNSTAIGGIGSSNFLDNGYSGVITNTFQGTNASLIISRDLTVSSNLYALQVNANVLVLTNGLSGTNITWDYSVWANTIANSSNALDVNNSYYLANMTNDCSVTNLTGLEAGKAKWATLTVSNGHTAAITLYFTKEGRRPLGINTTNALSIAAGKIGVLSLMTYGTLITNFCTTVEQ